MCVKMILIYIYSTYFSKIKKKLVQIAIVLISTLFRKWPLSSRPFFYPTNSQINQPLETFLHTKADTPISLKPKKGCTTKEEKKLVHISNSKECK